MSLQLSSIMQLSRFMIGLLGVLLIEITLGNFILTQLISLSTMMLMTGECCFLGVFLYMDGEKRPKSIPFERIVGGRENKASSLWRS